MAPPSEVFFPSLDECISGDTQLISWKSAFLSLTGTDGKFKSADRFSSFFMCSESLKILSNPFDPFPKPSTSSKASFETRTAAIHVTSSKATCDFDEIKSDALWLSKEAQIDEISALRILILAWQRRREDELLAHFSEEEITSLHDAVGVGRLPHASFRSELSGVLNYTGSRLSNSSDTKDAQQTRRKRLFTIYLSEKLHIIKVALFLLCESIKASVNDDGSKNRNATGKANSNDTGLKFGQLGTALLKGQDGDLSIDVDQISISKCIEAFRLCIMRMESGSWWSKSEPDHSVENSWQTSCLEELVETIQILLLLIKLSPEIPSSKVLLSWLNLMNDYQFLELVTPNTDQQTLLFSKLQAFISVTTLSFLKLRSASYLLENTGLQLPSSSDPSKLPYFFCRDDVAEISEIFLGIAQAGYRTASSAVFAWAIVLYTIGEIAMVIKEDREQQQAQRAVESYNNSTRPTSPPAISDVSIYEDIWEQARNPAYTEDFVRFLVSSAVDGARLLDLIFVISDQLQSITGIEGENIAGQWGQLELLELIRFGVQYLDYIPELVSAVLCIVSHPTPNQHLGHESAWTIKYDPRSAFFRDDVLVDKIFRNSKARFPYEALTFLKFCRALSGCSLLTEDGLPIICQELEHMDTYTQVIEPGFQDYRSIREDENANYVNLIKPLEMKEMVSSKEELYQGSQELMSISENPVLPVHTIGQVISESKPAVIMWHHQYNCLGFLGKWLEHTTSGRDSRNAPDNDVMVEIINLLADLMNSAHTISIRSNSESSAKRILEMTSNGLDNYSDIISVIFNIFERSLQSVGGASNSSQNLQLTMSCMHFISALIQVLPGRAWPPLVRSSLLASDGKGGVLDKIVFSNEAISGDLSFILKSIRLFEALVDDAITHVALRKTTAKVTSISHASDYTAGIPDHSMRKCLLNFVRAMVEIYNGSVNWKQEFVHQQLQISTSLSNTFRKILYYTYGIDDAPDLNMKIAAVFSDSAEYLLNALRPVLTEGAPFSSIMRILLRGFEAHVSTSLDVKWNMLIVSTLKLSGTLIRAGWLSDAPISTLEKQLFHATPLLVRLYTLDRHYQVPVAALLELLLSRTSATSEIEPPSLLGHLGAESSCRFLDSLSKFDQTSGSDSLNVAIWRLMTAIITKRQQWLAVFLLTGSSPKESLRSPKTNNTDEVSMKSKPFLEASLDLLSSIGTIAPQTAVVALDFVAKAQENWAWVTQRLSNHQKFFSAVTQYVATLNLSKVSPYEKCMNTKIAALVADICTVHLHSAKEARDWAFFRTLIPLVTWFSENAIAVDGYNASLHANLKRNFEMKYSGCKLSNIKRTALEQPDFGDDYFYDTPLGTQIFGYDFAWAGKQNQGFVEEVKRANLNLSLVEAQMSLLHSWKFFAIEHCSDFMPDREVQKSMVRVVHQCLLANSRDVPDDKIFHKLLETRAEFALALLHRLVEVKSRGSEVFSLLRVAWDTVRLRSSNYESSMLNHDTEYNGLLLNVLFLALQFHVVGASLVNPEAISKKPEVSSDLSIVVEIVKNVVANGFQALCTHLHEEPQKCSPKEFAILTAILQTALKVKDVDRIFEQITYHLADSDTIRYAATLFSWSHQLTMEGDPVYGELSILYLLELSCIPALAEQMAAEGILINLSTYQLTEIFRQPQGCGPFDPTPRLYSIWASGFLPLCLNLLYHIGRTVSEVAAFLNQFEGQLRRSSAAFSISNPILTSDPFLTLQQEQEYEHSVRRNLSSARYNSTRKISLSMATEACSLALISMIIQKFRRAGPSAGVDPQNIQELKWDNVRVKDDIEALLEKRSMLRSRITPTSEKEISWSQQPPKDKNSGSQSLLEEKVVRELQTAVSCMAGSGQED
ncbi:hypothetical protein FQN57_003886 [Myotisia sp. PD_48]|nr:hypothetical protein FQN57_003886 [Myotisia sp. PD_48]